MSQLIPVREEEKLAIPVLEVYLKKNIPSISEENSLVIQQFGAGASNLTYALTIGNWKGVLRRPPLGPVAAKAHDMEREFMILQVLHQHFPTAPQPYLFSNDVSIVGSPFFVMERKHGVLLDKAYPEGTQVTKELNAHVSQLMVDTLVKLHDIPYEGTPLEKISRPNGFMERQVSGWIGRYERAKTDDIFEVEVLKKWLVDKLPTSLYTSIIHYDYKLNNTLFSDDFSSIVGLFDWEMTTVGDPLADVGAAMSYWVQKDDPKLLLYGLGKPSVTILDGFYTRQQFIEEYAKKSGRDMSNIHYYITFAYFKLAVICQQIYYRYKKGQTKDGRFAHLNEFVKTLMFHAVQCSKEEA
ncbi:MAG: phosphotransferase family protein [Bacillaceae bacterium]